MTSGWYKVVYTFSIVDEPGPRDSFDSRIVQFVSQYNADHVGDSNRIDVGESAYTAKGQYFDTFRGMSETYYNEGYWPFAGIFQRGHWGDIRNPASFVTEHTEYMMMLRTVTDVVTDPNFTPPALQGGSISYSSTADNTLYIDPQSLTISHIGYEWVRGDVSIVDEDHNGYDDRGQHDTGKGDPKTQDIQLPADQSALLQLLASAASQVVDQETALKYIERVEGLAGAAALAFDEGNALLEVSRAGWTDSRTNFIVGTDLLLKTAMTAGAIGLAIAGAPITALAMGVVSLVYVATAEGDFRQTMGSLWDNYLGPNAAEHNSIGLQAETGTLPSTITVPNYQTHYVVFDESFYQSQHSEVAAALLNGSASSAFSHYLTVGVANGYQPNATDTPVSPSDLSLHLANDDPAAGSRVVARVAPLQSYSGDGASASERQLFASLSAGRTGVPPLALDTNLTALANRVAIDLVANEREAPLTRVQHGENLSTLTFGDGSTVASHFSDIDLSTASIFVLATEGASAQTVLTAFEEWSAAKSAIDSGSNSQIGIAEYGGVWVVLVAPESFFSTTSVRDEAPMTLIHYGSGADDLLFAGQHASKLYGLDGSDHLVGGHFDDVLDGGAGADKLYGGTGNDNFIVDRQDDIVFENAGEGTDTVTSSASYYLYANIENLTLATGAGNIFGVGNELANTITGNDGGNTLLAGAGNDTVYGGSGVDILYGEGGADQLFGDADNDVIVGGGDNDAIDGGTGGDSLYGEDGNDTLIGGTDFVFDQLVGGAGNDILHADSGLGDFDYLIGNTGDDSYYVDTYADLVFENAGEGTDTVYASTAAGSGYYLYANLENLVLTGQTFYGVGNELANTMTGSALDNWLLGGAGNDVLNGKGGNDVLFGQDGADIFVFEHGTGGDTIADFTAGTDKIDLSAFGFTSFAQVQAAMSENGGSSAIVLGGGDLIVLQNITNASFHAGDFILTGGSAAQIEQLVQGDPNEPLRGNPIHQFDMPWLMVGTGDQLNYAPHL